MLESLPLKLDLRLIKRDIYIFKYHRGQHLYTSCCTYRNGTRKIGDAFMGYHDDTCAAIILHVCQEKKCDDQAIPHIEKEVCIFCYLMLFEW